MSIKTYEGPSEIQFNGVTLHAGPFERSVKKRKRSQADRGALAYRTGISSCAESVSDLRMRQKRRRLRNKGRTKALEAARLRELLH